MNVANRESFLRAMDKDAFEMTCNNDSQGSPIRFLENELQAHHDVGTVLFLADEDDFVIGIVTKQISTSDSLNIDVTIAKELVTDQDGSFKIRFEDTCIRRNHRMRKVIF